MKLSRREWFVSLSAIVAGKFYKPKPIEDLQSFPLHIVSVNRLMDPNRIDFVCYDPGWSAMIYNVKIPENYV